MLESATLACAEYGRGLRASDLYAAGRVCNATRRAVAVFHQQHDVVLTPTMNVPNTPLGYLDQNDADIDARGWYDRVFSTAGFTALSDVTGDPAISLPLGRTEEGWPIGVQIGAPYGAEGTLIALAGDLERAMPWQHHRPPPSVDVGARTEVRGLAVVGPGRRDDNRAGRCQDHRVNDVGVRDGTHMTATGRATAAGASPRRPSPVRRTGAPA